MLLVLKFGIVTTIAVLAFGEYVTIQRNYGDLSPYFNQTSWGWYRWVKADSTLQNISSIWMQDDLNKRLRIDVGARGEQGFVAEFYFFSDHAYEVTPDSKDPNKIVCSKVADANYTSEVSTYGEPNFGFLGRHIMAEYGGVMADLYAGQALDAAGILNCLFYCDSFTCTKYLGMVVTGVANKYSFSEYWYGDNLTSVVPPSSFFDLPPECNDAKVEYFFENPRLDSSSKIMTKRSSFCDQQPIRSRKSKNMLLYRSTCCDLEKELD